MIKLARWWVVLGAVLLAVPSHAQRRPAPPSGSPSPQGERQISPQPAAPVQRNAPAQQPPAQRNAPAQQQPAQPTGPATSAEERQRTCAEVRKNAKYGIYFDKVEIEKLVQTVADATCRTFILPENVRGRISIVGPENGRVEVNGDQFYAAFLAALDANGLTVYQNGQFLKIVDKRSAKQTTIPTVLDPDQPYTGNEQMITKMFRVKYVDVEPLRGVIQQLVSKDGDTIPFPPDTIIVNDVGSNMHRIERIIEQLDSRSSSDELRVIQIQFAAVNDVVSTLQKIFESKSTGQRQQRGNVYGSGGTPPAPPPTAQGAEGATTETGGGSSGPVTVSQMIPDERTNKLIVVASPAALQRIENLLREIDVPISGEGRINVYALQHANAEDMASTMQSLAQGTANRPRAAAGAPNVPQVARAAAAAGGTNAAELFSGEVKISADKATNSLVIVASQGDYRNLLRVIEKLDIPRRQVFVEAVIMEVNLDRTNEFGVGLHDIVTAQTDQGPLPIFAGTKYTRSGLPPSFSILNLANFGGFLAGLQGPVMPELAKLGLNFPSFGVVLHAFQQSSDVNVLSTPHILTSDNEEAEITVGQNVPFQAGFSPSNLGLGTGVVPGATGTNATSLLGGLASQFAPINRQNVELKLTVKPQINESDFVRLVISEQTEEIASQDPVLGPTTSKRSAKTTVVAKDQETVVIGGIMQDRTIDSVAKVPILGDVPLLGHLFRETSRKKVKTNLLLFLTPYIIRDQTDFRRIFERKMRERQQFVERFYGQVPGYDVPIDFTRKAGPLGRINQAVLRESQKAENGGPGAPGEKVIKPVGGQPAAGTQSGGTPAPQPAPEPGVNEPAAPEGSEVVPGSPPSPSPAPTEPDERIRVQPGNEQEAP